MSLTAWTTRGAPWIAATLALVGVAAVVRFVDLSPRVEGDFFFADDDPQMLATRRVSEDFPVGAQIILRVEDLAGDPAAYRDRVASLTDELVTVPGVERGFSISTNDPTRSPLYARILLTPDEHATNVVLLVDGTDPEVLLPHIEEVVAHHLGPELGIVISGVPAIVEMIRRSLYRDLVVFSVAAVVVFALIIGVVYRDGAVVLGTLSTCLVAVSLTLLLVQAMNVGIGLLTANLVTIVFVLTLSHVVFLSANWRRALREAQAELAVVGMGPGTDVDRASVLRAALRLTWEGSFWSMATTLLGFASLLVATARPLRELGVAGVVGSLTALAVAYLVYPAFLGAWAGAGPGGAGATDRVPGLGQRWWVGVIGAVVLFVGLGVPHVNTDPGLLSYFAEGTELHDGLARIDADGGSSTLDIVVEDPGGQSIATRAVYAKLEALQRSLEADSAVGVVLSPTVLIEHARTIPLAGLLPVRVLLDIATSDALEGVGLGFVRPDRSRARYSLRMRESVREPRQEVVDRLRGDVEQAGLEPVVVAGLYDLQAQLGRLIRASLRLGIGGLLVLFLGIAVIVARSAWTVGALWLCLAAIPVVILGTFGHAGIAIDIITSPSANIALAIGADSMIHLVVRMRRLRAVGIDRPWAIALSQVGPAVLGASLIVSAGFGIFTLSTFPPTRRFGLAVIVGTITAATMALVVLPRLACLLPGGAGSLSPAQTPGAAAGHDHGS